jgi:hypothetical protein
MSAALHTFIQLRNVPNGRAQWACKQIAERASAPEHAAIREHALAAAAHFKACAQGRRLLAQQRNLPPDRRLSELDNTLDRLLTAIMSNTQQLAVNLDTDDPLRKQALTFHAHFFPSGVAAYTHLPWTLQTTEINNFTSEARERFADDLRDLGLLPLFDRLERLNAEFQALLEASPAQSLTASALVAQESAGQTLLHEIVAAALGLTWRETPENLQTRAHLLQPLLDQLDALRRARQRRRPATDINGDTGEEDDPATPPGP